MRQLTTIFIIAMCVMNVIIAWRRNGLLRPKRQQTYNLKLQLIAFVIQMALLYCAGLFDNFTE